MAKIKQTNKKQVNTRSKNTKFLHGTASCISTVTYIIIFHRYGNVGRGSVTVSALEAVYEGQWFKA